MPKRSNLSVQKNAYATWILKLKKIAQDKSDQPIAFELILKEVSPAGSTAINYRRTLSAEDFFKKNCVLAFAAFSIQLENGKLTLNDVEADCNIVLDAAGDLYFKEKINLDGYLMIEKANRIFIDSGLEVQGALRITCAKLVNRGEILADTIQLKSCLEQIQAISLDNQMGQIQARRSMRLQAGSLDNQRGKILAEQLEIQTLGQFDNRRGVVLAKNGITIGSAMTVQNTEGQFETETGLLSIRCKEGRITNTHYACIRSKSGTVLLEAPSVLTEETSLVHGKELTKIRGHHKLIQESVLGGNQLELESEHLDLNGIVARKTANIIGGKKAITLQKSIASLDRLLVSAHDLNLAGQLFAKTAVISVQGKLNYLENLFRIQQALDLSLKEGLDFIVPIQVLGSVSITLSGSAKTPITVLADITIGSKKGKTADFVLRTPQSLLRFGSEGGRYLTAYATGKIVIQALGFDLVCGRMVGQQGLSIDSTQSLTIGRLNSQQTMPSGLISDGILDLRSRLGELIIQQATLKGQSALTLHSPIQVDNLSAALSTLGDCLIDSPLFKHRIAIQQCSGGQRSNLSNGSARAAYRTSGTVVSAIGKPASLIVGKTLVIQGRIEVFASQIHHNGFQGKAPKQTSFIPSVSWTESYLCGHKKARKCSWSHNQRQSFGTPILAVFSSGQELQLINPTFELSGIVFAPSLKLASFLQGNIGWVRMDIQLPASRAFQSRIVLSDFMKPNPGYSLQESTGVFQSVLAGYIKPSTVPLTILCSDGSLTTLHSKIDCQLPAELQAELIVQILLSEFGRGFLDTLNTTPESMYHQLQHNAHEFQRQGQGIAGLDKRKEPIWTARLQVPILVYRTQTVLGKIQLIPDLIFPLSWNNPKLRDWAGGLFSLSTITIEGMGRDCSSLTITSHLQSTGKIRFCHLKQLTQQKHLYRNTVTHEEVHLKQKYLGLYRKKTSHHHQLHCATPQVGNTLEASGVEYRDIDSLTFKGITMLVGNEGVTSQQIGSLSEQPVMAQGFETHHEVYHHFLGREKVTELGLTEEIVPSKIQSRGSVQLSADRSTYQSLQLGCEQNIHLSAKEQLDFLASKKTVRHPSQTIVQGLKRHHIQNSSEQGLPVALYAGGDIVCSSEGGLQCIGTELRGKNILLTAEKTITQRPLVLNQWKRIRSRGIQGFSVFRSEIRERHESGIVPTLIAEENIDIQSRKSNVLLIAPLLYAGHLLSISAPEGEVIIRPAAFHQDMSSRQVSFAMSFFGSESIETLVHRDCSKAAKALLREFPLLARLRELMQSKDTADFIGSGLKTLYHFHHVLENLAHSTSLKQLIADQWDFNPSIRVGGSTSSITWTVLALPWLQAQNILLTAKRLEASGLQVEAQNFQVKTSEQALFTAAPHHKSEHIYQGGVTLGFKMEGTPYAGIDFNLENSRAIEYCHAHFNIAKQFKVVSDGTVSMQGLYVKTLEAIIKAENLTLQTLQDRQQRTGGGASLFSTMAVSVSFESQHKRWSSEQTGIEAQEILLINIRNELKLLGSKLLLINPKPLSAKLPSGETLSLYAYPLVEGLEAVYPVQPNSINIRVWKRNGSNTLEMLSLSVMDINAPTLELFYHPEADEHTFLYPKPGLLRAAKLTHRSIQDSDSSHKLSGSADLSGIYNPFHWIKAVVDCDYQRDKATQINRATVSDDIAIFTEDPTVTVNRSKSLARSFDDLHCHYRAFAPVGDPEKITKRLAYPIKYKELFISKAQKYFKQSWEGLKPSRTDKSPQAGLR